MNPPKLSIIMRSYNEGWALKETLPALEVYKINIDAILHGETADFPIKPNDLVYIPKSAIGEWNKFVQQLLPSLQAVLSGLLIESYLYNQSLRP